jgi:hypothetical protein
MRRICSTFIWVSADITKDGGQQMRVLVGCEESGVVRDAFRAKGHEAWSCDLIPSENNTYHLEMDVMEAIRLGPWDLIILHPECTHLALSGNRWYGRGTGGHHKRVEAVRWTARLWKLAKANAPRVALENPTSVIFPILKREVPVQYIQPYEYGHREKKKTGFALYNLMRSRTYEGVAQAMCEQWGEL